MNKTEINDFFRQFCLGFWELSSEESKLDGFFFIANKSKQNCNFSKLLINSFINKSLKNELIDQISKTQGRIIIRSYGFSDDNEIFDLIIKNRFVLWYKAQFAWKREQ